MMIPSSSLKKTCASKNHNNSVWFDDLIDLLISLADHGSFESNDPLVTLYMWPRKADSHKATKNYTKYDICMIEWIDQLFYDFLWFCDFNGFELMIYVH